MRTNQEIVDQTNELARRFAARQGYLFARGCKFYKPEDSPRALLFYWEMACIAQKELTGTDAENALAELESSEEVK